VEVDKIVQDAEPEGFKMRFGDWGKSDGQTHQIKTDKETQKMDIDILYSIPENFILNHQLVEETMQTVNNYLEAFTIFVYQRGKFLLLPESERGHFFQKDSYAFLCVYRAPKKALKRLIDHSIDISDVPELLNIEEIEEEDDLQCVVYFCQSRQASRVAFSTFKLSTQKEMEDLVKEMYGCEVRVEIVEYGREPFALLAHLENNFVMHMGSRLDPYVSKDRFYQIRSDFRYGTVRSYEVLKTEMILSGTDCIYVRSNTAGSYLYKGPKVKAWTFDVALELGSKAADFFLSRDSYGSDFKDANEIAEPLELTAGDNIDEPSETRCRIVDSEDPIPEFLEIVDLSRYLAPDMPNVRPLFFVCNTTSGYFKVHRLFHFTQTDLKSDSCVFIDTGFPDPIYCWFGRDTSEIVRKLTKYCIDIWLTTLQDGRLFESDSESPRFRNFNAFLVDSMRRRSSTEGSKSVLISNDGEEKVEFKSFFQAWDRHLLSIPNPGNSFTRVQHLNKPEVTVVT
jgi:hypothetical protein